MRTSIKPHLHGWKAERKRFSRVMLLLAVAAVIVHETAAGYWWVLPSVPMFLVMSLMLTRSRWPLAEAERTRIDRGFVYPQMYATVSLFMPVLVLVALQFFTATAWALAGFAVAAAVQGWYCETVSWRTINSKAEVFHSMRYYCETVSGRALVRRDISMRSPLTIDQSWHITDEIRMIEEGIAAIDNPNDFVSLQLQQRRKELRLLLRLNEQPIFVQPSGLWSHTKTALFGPDQIKRNVDDQMVVPDYLPQNLQHRP